MLTFDRTIRPSSTPGFADCFRRQFARSYAGVVAWAGYELRPLPGHIGAAVGTATHTAVAETLAPKVTTGELGSEKVAMDAAVAKFDETVADGVVWDECTSKTDTAYKQIGRMTSSYRAHLAPIVEPVAVELRERADVGGGWSVSGQLDLLTQSPGMLRDLKTGRMRRANYLQYGTYRLLFRSHRYDVNKLTEDFVARASLSKEQPAPISVAVPAEAASQDAWSIIEDIKRRAERFVDLGQSGERPPHTVLPANPNSMLCHERFCPAWGTSFCRAHEGAE